MSKTLHLFMLLALLIVGGGISVNAQKTKTFSFAETSKTAGTLTDAPTGVTATFKNTGSNANDQLTANNSMTLTISGLAEGTKITGVNLNVHNNSNKGKGSATVTLGNSTLGTLTITGLGATYVSKDVTPFTEGTVTNGQNLVITIKATANSVYCNKFTISYQEPASGKTATTLAFADPVDRTFALNATDNLNFTNAATLSPAVEGATITYSSDNENIAVVDENGEVLVETKAEGKATITASYAGNDQYDAATASYTITVADPNQPRWIKTDLTALTPTDQFVIVDLTSKTAMSNDKGTTDAPVATAVTLNDDKTEITSEVADNLKWNVTATDGSYTFYPNGSTSTWLYVSGSSSNNNLRVGTGDDKTFTAYASGNYSGLKGTDGTNDRYIHSYSNQDWRTYKNATQTSTSIAYFKRFASGEKVKTATKVTFEKGDQTLTQDTETGLAEVKNIASVTTADGKAIDGASVTYTSSDDTNAPVNNAGEVTVDISKAGKYTITASYAGDDTYAASSATYTITVEESLNLTGAGTEENPYTVADALTIINKDRIADLGTGVYVKGTVANITSKNINSTYGSLNYTISDDDATNTIAVYGGLYVDSTKFTDISQVAAGDIVLVKGDLLNYNNKTPEINKNNYIVKFYDRSATLDEAATDENVKAGHGITTITLKRTFNDNAWNTLVLPFDLTAEQVTAAFGSDAKVASYTGATAGSDGTYTLNFKEATTITANVPVFIHSAQANSDGYTFTGVEVKDATPTQTADGFNFVGTYVKTTVPQGNFFINANNKFFKAGDNQTNIKATRATFAPATAAASEAKSLGFNVNEGGETTAINAVTFEEETNANAPIYNLAGQRVSKAYKGVVLQNGKKFLQK